MLAFSLSARQLHAYSLLPAVVLLPGSCTKLGIYSLTAATDSRNNCNIIQIPAVSAPSKHWCIGCMWEMIENVHLVDVKAREAAVYLCICPIDLCIMVFFLLICTVCVSLSGCIRVRFLVLRNRHQNYKGKMYWCIPDFRHQPDQVCPWSEYLYQFKLSTYSYDNSGCMFKPMSANILCVVSGSNFFSILCLPSHFFAQIGCTFLLQ